jgi:hypothetical protein
MENEHLIGGVMKSINAVSLFFREISIKRGRASV